MDRDIIIDVFLLTENYFEHIKSIESNAILAGFISNTPETKTDDQEFIFLVDCSKSMNTIELAREVLCNFLNILPINCQFNIICFNSIFYSLFDKTITDQYSKLNSKKAKKFIENIKIDRTSKTELLELFRWLHYHRPILNKSRQIVLLTAGQISNSREIIDLCNQMAV